MKDEISFGYMEDEKELTDRCKKGESSAFKQVYDKYAGSLLAICMRYAGNRMDAEDILHNAFLKIFRSFDKFTFYGKGSLKAWLMRIAINESVEFLRNRKTELASTVDIDAMDKEIEDDTTDEMVDADTLFNIPKEKLMAFIGELPDGYRSVFNLYVFEGKSHKEIGQMLGITERTSSSQLARAKRLLRNKIMDYLNSDKHEK